MLNLMDKLSNEDKKLIENYIQLNGECGEDYCGNELFLSEWAKNKKTLYHLLGGTLQYRIPNFTIEKSSEAITRELRGALENHNFEYSFRSFIYYLSEHDYIEYNDRWNLLNLTDTYASARVDFFNNKVLYSYKITRMKQGKEKVLQIASGAKLLKTIQNVLKFYKDVLREYFLEKSSSASIDKTAEELEVEVNNREKEFYEEFEDYRIKHSLVLNDKVLRGDLVLSIHPLDFLTMSNNNSGWSSCMHWGGEDPGCYHIGTIEMMNSNNVICCYLESDSKKYSFGADDNAKLLYWNNKKWRQLVIVNKDIIVSGKAYPYQNKGITTAILETLNKLAKENCGWTYQFGIEEYRDMEHIYCIDEMARNRDWIRGKKTTKHNIILHTKGMYNDYFNDSKTIYYCYRNKVKHNIMLSYSGKALCTRCAKPILEWTDAWTSDIYGYDDLNCDCDYNERYSSTGADICDDCRKMITCEYCEHKVVGKDNLIQYKGKLICYKCFSSFFTTCGECGKIFSPKETRFETPTGNKLLENLDSYYIRETGLTEEEKKGKLASLVKIGSEKVVYDKWHSDDIAYIKEHDNENVFFCINKVCPECRNKVINKFNYHKETLHRHITHGRWDEGLYRSIAIDQYRHFSTDNITKADLMKYCWEYPAVPEKIPVETFLSLNEREAPLT